MEESSSQRTEPTFSAEAILLSGVPAYILLARYVFELGVASYFDYPYQLISVSTSQIFLSFAQALVVIALIVLGLQIGDWLFVKLVRDRLTDDEASLFGLAFAWWLMTIVITLFLGGFTLPQLGYMTMTFLAVPTLLVAGHKKFPETFAPLINRLLNVRESSQVGIFGTLRRVFGERTVVIAVILLLSSIYWFWSGLSFAGRQTTYLVLNDNEVVIRIYDDKAIVNELMSANQLGEGFKVLQLGDVPDLIMTKQVVGKLKR